MIVAGYDVCSGVSCVFDNVLYHIPKTSLLIDYKILTMIDHIWNYLFISPQNYNFTFETVFLSVYVKI